MKQNSVLAVRLATLLLCTFGLHCLQAQTCFKSIEAAKASGEKVEWLDLSKQKLEYLPKELFDFKDLKRLNLYRNRLSGDLDSLSLLTELRYLNIASNNVSSLSAKLSCLDLDTLIMWDNPFYEFDTALSAWDLEYLDLRAVQMTRQEQAAIRSLFPKARLRLDHPCNCGARKREKYR